MYIYFEQKEKVKIVAGVEPARINPTDFQPAALTAQHYYQLNDFGEFRENFVKISFSYLAASPVV